LEEEGEGRSDSKLNKSRRARESAPKGARAVTGARCRGRSGESGRTFCAGGWAEEGEEEEGEGLGRERRREGGRRGRSREKGAFWTF
jgi:hypothetical protein